MPKEDFFDEDEENVVKPTPPETDDKSDKTDKDEKKADKPAEKETKPESEEIDWKAKYEAVEAAQKDDRYYDELLRFDDTLDGKTLDELEGGKEYRKLREMGLSPKKAYAALTAVDEDGTSDKGSGGSKSHVSATNFRRTQGTAKMDRETRQAARAIFGDSLSDAEMEKLYKRFHS